MPYSNAPLSFFYCIRQSIPHKDCSTNVGSNFVHRANLTVISVTNVNSHTNQVMLISQFAQDVPIIVQCVKNKVQTRRDVV